MIKNNRINDIATEMTAVRRELHQNPQTCYEEVFASDLIAKQLTAWGISFERGWAKTGIVAKVEGQSTSSGKSIGLRADIDALDILETSGQAWASKIPGKMHGCGHDGHTSTLLGAAKYLHETRNFNGTVYLIFQPAEEGGGGAIKMIEEGLFKKHPMDAVYGFHNWPWLPLGSAALRPGPMMACSDVLEIKLTGKGGHAAYPQDIVDIVYIGSQIIVGLQSIVSRNVSAADSLVITVPNFNAGTGADNVMPDSAYMLGTVRAFREEIRTFAEKRITEIAQGIATSFGAKAEVIYTRNYDPTINTPQEAMFCADIARGLFGDAHVDTNVDLCMGAEDFGAFLTKVPGAYIYIGQGTKDAKSPHNKGLHHPGYDFNDALIPYGIKYWQDLVEKRLPL